MQSGIGADGNPISGPWQYVYAGCKGDLEWHQQAYDLAHYYRCNLLCHRCFASKVDADLNFLRLDDSAPWRSTTVQDAQFLANIRTRGHPLPALCTIRGWSCETMLWDLMHTLFIGVGNDCCGSALKVLCEAPYFKDDSFDSQLRVAHAACERWYKNHTGAQMGLPPLDPKT